MDIISGSQQAPHGPDPARNTFCLAHTMLIFFLKNCFPESENRLLVLKTIKILSVF